MDGLDLDIEYLYKQRMATLSNGLPLAESLSECPSDIKRNAIDGL